MSCTAHVQALCDGVTTRRCERCARVDGSGLRHPQVIGINTMKVAGMDGIAFAVPIDDVKRVVNMLQVRPNACSCSRT